MPDNTSNVYCITYFTKRYMIGFGICFTQFVFGLTWHGDNFHAFAGPFQLFAVRR